MNLNDQTDVRKTKNRLNMCDSNNLENESLLLSEVDLDSELDIKTGFNDQFEEKFIWDQIEDPSENL